MHYIQKYFALVYKKLLQVPGTCTRYQVHDFSLNSKSSKFSSTTNLFVYITCTLPVHTNCKNAHCSQMSTFQCLPCHWVGHRTHGCAWVGLLLCRRTKCVCKFHSSILVAIVAIQIHIALCCLIYLDSTSNQDDVETFQHGRSCVFDCQHRPRCKTHTRTPPRIDWRPKLPAHRPSIHIVL